MLRLLSALVVSAFLGVQPALAQGEPQGPRLSLDLHDADLPSVLFLLAEISGTNMVVSQEVKGRVTLRVHHLTAGEILRTVLEQKGLGMERSGGVLLIDTLEAQLTRAESRSRARAAREASAPSRTVLLPVRYARAEELLPVVRGMLSPGGRVSVDARTNTLIITETAAAP